MSVRALVLLDVVSIGPGLKPPSSVASRADKLSSLVNISFSKNTFPLWSWSARNLPGLSCCTVHTCTQFLRGWRFWEVRILWGLTLYSQRTGVLLTNCLWPGCLQAGNGERCAKLRLLPLTNAILASYIWNCYLSEKWTRAARVKSVCFVVKNMHLSKSWGRTF